MTTKQYYHDNFDSIGGMFPTDIRDRTSFTKSDIKQFQDRITPILEHPIEGRIFTTILSFEDTLHLWVTVCRSGAPLRFKSKGCMDGGCVFWFES